MKIRFPPSSSVLVLIMIMSLCKTSKAQMAPALFVFGDSLVDVGNNDYLSLSVAKANHLYYGIDFPTHQPTGRWSNGNNSADFLAEKLGLPSSPAFMALLDNKTSNFPTGVNFASGGSGIFYGMDEIFGQVISMHEQVLSFTVIQQAMVQQLGNSTTQQLLSEALFAIVTGSNDVMSFYGFENPNNSGTPAGRVNSMIGNITAQLQQIYNLGARKFAVFGVGPVGCCPRMRLKNVTYGCHAPSNYLAAQYNQRIVTVLDQLKSKLNGFQYMYFDTYNALLDILNNASAYGITNVSSACCGVGPLGADWICEPVLTSLCADRSEYFFFDLYHPTETVASLAVNAAFDGSQQYTYPMNIRQLMSS